MQSTPKQEDVSAQDTVNLEDQSALEADMETSTPSLESLPLLPSIAQVLAKEASNAALKAPETVLKASEATPADSSMKHAGTQTPSSAPKAFSFPDPLQISSPSCQSISSIRTSAPGSPFPSANSLDLQAANRSLLPHVSSADEPSTSYDSERPAAPLSRPVAPPPTLASSEPDTVAAPPPSDASGATSSMLYRHIPQLAAGFTPKQLATGPESVKEASKWEGEVEHAFDKAFKMLRRLGDDDERDDPAVGAEEHMLRRVKEMRGRLQEMEMVLGMVEGEAVEMVKKAIIP